MLLYFFFFKQKTAYEMRISDWSSDVCSSDLSGELTQRLGVVDQGLVQLAQAADPQCQVGRPVRLVEGASSRGDCGVHVLRSAVGGHPDLLAGGGVEDRVGG